MKIGIIGAGFAGVAASRVIAKEGHEVSLFSAEKVPPYYRQRLPELAFGQEEPENIFLNSSEWYSENGIDLRLNTRVKAFNSDFEISTESGEKYNFDALIVATGGGPVIPPFAAKGLNDFIFPLWNYADAQEIRARCAKSKHMLIIGGGIIGIESALRAERHNLKISIVEKMPHLMSRNFSKKASKVIETQLLARGVDLYTGKGVETVEKGPDGECIVKIEGNESIKCDFVVISIGAGFDNRMADAAGLKTDKQIIVDKHLSTSLPGIFAAGDVAQFTLPRPCSAKEALQQGKAVGENIVAYLKGEEMKEYEVLPVPVRFKYDDFELYSIGLPPGKGDEVKLLDYDAVKVYRGCVYENSALAGVQMVGSSKDFLKYQQEYLVSRIWEKMKGGK